MTYETIEKLIDIACVAFVVLMAGLAAFIWVVVLFFLFHIFNGV